MNSPPTHNNDVRRFKAKYGLTRELTMEKNIAFDSGESVWFSAPVIQRKGWFQRVSGLVWLTQERLLLLEHYAFVRDCILEVPRACVTFVERLPLRRVVVTYLDSSGVGKLDLQQYPPINDDGDQFADAVERFKSGDSDS